MKKLCVLLFVLLLFLIIVPTKVKADMFEKPTAEIEIIGIEEPYYFDILIYIDYNVEKLSEEDLSQVLQNYYKDDYPLAILNGYRDEDGYVSRTLYSGIPASLSEIGNNTYKIGYHSAPQRFKIAIVTKAGVIITSDVIERKMFTSKMTYDLTGVDFKFSTSGVGVVNEQIPYGHISWRFVVRVICTVLVELGILFLFKFRNKKSYILVAITNIITQSLLTLFMFLGYYSWGATFGLIRVIVIGEFLVFASEMVAYGLLLNEKKRAKAILYGFVANLATLIISILTLNFI